MAGCVALGCACGQGSRWEQRAEQWRCREWLNSCSMSALAVARGSRCLDRLRYGVAAARPCSPWRAIWNLWAWRSRRARLWWRLWPDSCSAQCSTLWQTRSPREGRMAEFPNAVERGEFLTSLKGNWQSFRRQ